MDLHLPGPPLAEWFVYNFADAKMAVWTGADAGRGRVGRVLRATLLALRGRLGWTTLAPGQRGLDGLVVLTALGEGSDLPAAGLAAVRPGGWLIELGHPPAVSAWRPLQWVRRGRALRRASEVRAREWLGRGCHAIEQWAPVDLPQALVTCGRVRAIPSA